MITTTAIIRLIEGENEKLKSVSLPDISPNNISPNIGNAFKTHNSVENGFILGGSKLYDGSKFYSKSKAFIGELVAESDGKFPRSYLIFIEAESDLKRLWISFDDTNDRFPLNIIVNGKAYENNSPNFFIKDIGEQSGIYSHIIEIPNWNTPFYPLVISGIYIDTDIVINGRNKKEISVETAEKSNLEKPSFGIISNSGTITYEEKSVNIKSWVENDLLKSKSKVEIYLENSKRKRTKIDEKLIVTWNYDEENEMVTLDLNDGLQDWQSIDIEPIYYNILNDTPQNLKFYYDHLYMATPSKFNMLTFDELDPTTKDILENIMVEIPYLSSTNLWRAWTNVCQISGCYIFMENGRTQFRYRGGK